MEPTISSAPFYTTALLELAQRPPGQDVSLTGEMLPKFTGFRLIVADLVGGRLRVVVEQLCGLSDRWAPIATWDVDRPGTYPSEVVDLSERWSEGLVTARLRVRWHLEGAPGVFGAEGLQLA